MSFRWTNARLVAALLAVIGFVLPACAQAPQRIVAIGDVHGDAEAWFAILRAAGLIDQANEWAGGETILVQTGDIPDRGPDTLRIMRHLMALQDQAAEAGGQVVALVGNHEAMNITGDLRYVTAAEFAAFADENSEARRQEVWSQNRRSIKRAYRRRVPRIENSDIEQTWRMETPLGWAEHRQAWSPRGELGSWVAGNPVVAKVGDTLFAHGGLSTEYAGQSLAALNKRVRSELSRRDTSADALINDPLGPLWYRGLVRRDAEDARRPPIKEEVTAILAAHDAARIVIGHTPVLDGVRYSGDRRVIQIDTGMSAHYGGVRGWLEIVGDDVTAGQVQDGNDQ
ncbi:MAG: metallophosphoesterase [Pacificimonas sp.]